MKRISMKEMIERIIKRAYGADVAKAWGPYLVARLMEGAVGARDGEFRDVKSGIRKYPELVNADTSFITSAEAAMDMRSINKMKGQFGASGYEPEEMIDQLVMKIVESGWAYKLGKQMSGKILSGQFTLTNFRKLLSFKMDQAKKDLFKVENKRRDKSKDPYGGGTRYLPTSPGEEDERGMDQFEDTNTRSPMGWADSASELLIHLMEDERGPASNKIKDFLDRQLRSVRPESVQRVAIAVLEWSRANPGRKFNFTAIGNELGMSRQNVSKFWNKAIEQMARNVRSDKKIQEILNDHAHHLRAASIQAKVSKVIHTSSGTPVGVVELCFTLSGPRVASANPQVDPRTHLASSPKTLDWILNKSKHIIQDAVHRQVSTQKSPVQISELVINEKLSHTWAARVAEGKTRFKVMVGFKG